MTDPAGNASGRLVAVTFHRLLAAVFLIAWLSLGVQVQVLIGSDGLLPIADLLRDQTVNWLHVPTLFWLDASDTAIRAGVWLGAVLAIIGIAGIRPRVIAALSTLLYLSYCVACRDFLSFQWDNLLIECGFLATFLPVDREARWIHVLFRLLIIKLYWESGIAKWQSHLGDWQDGSAMAAYYETAPLPTWLAWYAHRLPDWWHYAESWMVLAFELVLPLAVFGPRRARLACAAALTAFQLINIATANYGFFCYLATALHVFLLGDRDLRIVVRSAPVPAGGLAVAPPPPWPWLMRTVTAVVVSTLFVVVSLLDGLRTFAPAPSWPALSADWYQPIRSWRLVNTYHLFGHITRERIEPEFQIRVGGLWKPFDMLYKPGALDRPPPFVAPHQPRVDFRLWFYGLSYRRGMPRYVGALLQRLCADPESVQPLFAGGLPADPQAVRIVFSNYRFTEGNSAGNWWRREHSAETNAIDCAAL
jgi:hypothetical protein